jgi:hypothetical protein
LLPEQEDRRSAEEERLFRRILAPVEAGEEETLPSTSAVP